MLRCLSLFLVVLGLLFPGRGLAQETIGINFVGGGTLNGTPGTLASTEEAGFVPQRFWNNASGSSGTLAPVGDAGAETAASYSGFSVTWSASKGTNSTPIPDTGGNSRLMKGHLQGDYYNPVTVTLSNIPFSIPEGGYSVVVYLDGDGENGFRVGRYELKGMAAGTQAVFAMDKAGVHYAGSFRQVPVTSHTDEGQLTPHGNMIVFTGLTDPNLTLTVKGWTSSDGTDRATIAGIQLVNGFVGAPVPHSPETPVILNPAAGATEVSLTPLLEAGAFSDPDAGDTHVASRWSIYLAVPPISNNIPTLVFDSGITTVHKTSCQVPASAGLKLGMTYQAWVRYQDSTGAWSDYSTAVEFTTKAPPNNAPNTPTNVSPANTATGVNLPPTLQASAFYDVNGTDTHAASQWVVRRVSDNSVVFDSGTDTVNKTSRTVPGLAYSTAYSWQVRHRDNRGDWSGFSVPTSFITAADSSAGGGTPPVAELKGTYTGLIEGSSFSNDNSGFFTLVLSASGRFTGTFYLGGIRYTVRGTVDEAGAFSGTAKGGGRTLHLAFLLQSDDDAGRSLTGTVSEGSLQASLGGRSSAYSRQDPTSLAGNYTMMLLPPVEPGAIAQATGYGTAQISSAGKIRFLGVLGDGTKVSQGAQLSDDEWPCYLRPYKGRGLVLGKLVFREEPAISDFDGALKWFRPGGAKGAFFPVGADGEAQSTIGVVGSRYVSTKGERALDFADTAENGIVRLDGGHPGEAFELSEKLTLSLKNIVTVSGNSSTRVKISAGNGLFSGTFKDGSAKRAFKGVLFQKQNLATGLFKGAGEPGSVWIVDSRTVVE